MFIVSTSPVPLLSVGLHFSELRVAVEISKTINSIDTNKIDAEIASKEQKFSSKLISDLNEELVVLNQEITFLIQQQKFSQFRESMEESEEFTLTVTT